MPNGRAESNRFGKQRRRSFVGFQTVPDVLGEEKLPSIVDKPSKTSSGCERIFFYTCCRQICAVQVRRRGPFRALFNRSALAGLQAMQGAAVCAVYDQ
jgi:hypothetical protein